MKRLIRVALVALCLLVIALASLFVLIDANTFRPALQGQLATALGRQVELGNLRFSLFSGSLVADNLRIADDSGYSMTPFLTAKQLRIGVELKPLIFSRQLVVGSFAVVQPQIHLVQGLNGSWNFSSLGRPAAKTQKKLTLSTLTVGLIVIQDGRAVVESLPVQGLARVYTHLNLSVKRFAFDMQFPFAMSASLPAGGEVSMAGNLGPINQQNAAMTVFNAQISVKHLEPVAAGFLDSNVGVSMVADVNAHTTSDGQTLNSNGTVHMERLQLVKTGSPAPKTVDLTYNVAQNLTDNSGQLESAEIHIGHVAIHLNGKYQLVPRNPWMDVKLTGQNLPIDELQALMTSVGVTLPNGSVLKGGTLTIALTAVGPANNLIITGPLALENTQLVGFDVGSKIYGIAARSGIKTGDTTAIQRLRLNLQATNAGLDAKNVYAVMPAVGTVTGSGTVSPGGALAFRLVVKVTTARGLAKIGVGLLTKLHGMGHSKENVAEGMPMLVSGTANNPVITADMKGLRE